VAVDYGSITDSTTVVAVGGAQSDNSVPFRNIRIALEGQLATAAGQASISNIVYENTEFDISSLSKSASTIEWIRATLLPAETVASSLGTQGRDFHQGIFQIDYYCSTGVGGFNEKIDTLANNFKKGLTLQGGAGATLVDVKLRNVSLGVGRRDGAFFVRNIDVSYFAVTAARS